MTDWTTAQAGIAAAVATLPPGGNLVVSRQAPEARMQFTVTADGTALRTEVCNETPGDNERLSGRGWVMVDEWSGMWRRTQPLPASAEDVEKNVTEALYALRTWGHVRPDGFGYQAWRDGEERPAWQFWKPKGDVTLTFDALGLPRAKEPDADA